MSIRYERGTGYPNIRIAVKTNQIEVPTRIMQEKYGIRLFIRIPQLEYPKKVVEGDKLIHFGLPIEDENEGDTIALTRIVENGRYIPGYPEVPPLLSLENIWTGYLTKVISIIPFEDVAPDFFTKTIGNIRNIDELRERILIRYKRSLPTFSDGKILEKGISIREMILVKKLTSLII